MKQANVVATVSPEDIEALKLAQRQLDRARRAFNRAQVDYDDVMGGISERYELLQGHALNMQTGEVTTP